MLLGLYWGTTMILSGHGNAAEVLPGHCSVFTRMLSGAGSTQVGYYRGTTRTLEKIVVRYFWDTIKATVKLLEYSQNVAVTTNTFRPLLRLSYSVRILLRYYQFSKKGSVTILLDTIGIILRYFGGHLSALCCY